MFICDPNIPKNNGVYPGVDGVARRVDVSSDKCYFLLTTFLHKEGIYFVSNYWLANKDYMPES